MTCLACAARASSGSFARSRRTQTTCNASSCPSGWAPRPTAATPCGCARSTRHRNERGLLISQPYTSHVGAEHRAHPRVCMCSEAVHERAQPASLERRRETRTCDRTRAIQVVRHRRTHTTCTQWRCMCHETRLRHCTDPRGTQCIFFSLCLTRRVPYAVYASNARRSVRLSLLSAPRDSPAPPLTTSRSCQPLFALLPTPAPLDRSVDLATEVAQHSL